MNRAYRFARTRNAGFRRSKAGADSPAVEGVAICDSLESNSASAQVSVVSRAISPAVPPSNGREQPKIETSDAIRQSGNESRGNSEKTAKPNCYKCKYRGAIPGNAHSQCLHPLISHISQDPLMRVVGMLGSRGIAAMGMNLGRDEILNPGKNPMGISGHEHGIRSGWFNWPINFDPSWLLTCNGFEEK